MESTQYIVNIIDMKLFWVLSLLAVGTNAKTVKDILDETRKALSKIPAEIAQQWTDSVTENFPHLQNLCTQAVIDSNLDLITEKKEILAEIGAELQEFFSSKMSQASHIIEESSIGMRTVLSATMTHAQIDALFDKYDAIDAASFAKINAAGTSMVNSMTRYGNMADDMIIAIIKGPGDLATKLAAEDDIGQRSYDALGYGIGVFQAELATLFANAADAVSA